MEAGFAPLLPNVVKLCVDAVEEDVLVPVGASGTDPLDGMDSDEDAEDLARARELAVPAGALERQIAAAGCLREMAASCSRVSCAASTRRRRRSSRRSSTWPGRLCSRAS